MVLKGLERLARRVLPGKESMEFHEVSYGFVISNMADDVNPNLPVPEKFDEVMGLAEKDGMGIELQVEFTDTQNWDGEYHIGKHRLPFFGVHFPIRGVDIFSADDGFREDSLRKLLRTAEIAATMKADYIVVHMMSEADWDHLSDRNRLVKQTMQTWFDISRRVVDEGFEGKLLFENLQFPLYPGPKVEVCGLKNWLQELRQQGVDCGMVMDISHLWDSGLLIGENRWRRELNDYLDGFSRGEQSFSDYLAEVLNLVGDEVRLVHVTGGHITSQRRDTHLLPAITDQVFEDRVYLDARAALGVIHRDLREPFLVINEAHRHPYQEVIENNRCLQNSLEL